MSLRFLCLCSLQILAVNGKSLLNLSYDQSLKILQNTGTTVELTVSQIYKKSIPSKPVPIANNVQPNTKTSTVRNITRSMKNSFKFKKDRKDIDVKTSNVHKMTKNVDDSDPTADRNCRNGNDKSTFKVRSMPDLPKVTIYPCNGVTDRFLFYFFLCCVEFQVVGTVPKHQSNDKGTIPRTMGLSRKYVGPVRYPVTPIRPSSSNSATTEKQRLSLLADNDVDKQVFI